MLMFNFYYPIFKRWFFFFFWWIYLLMDQKNEYSQPKTSTWPVSPAVSLPDCMEFHSPLGEGPKLMLMFLNIIY